ncbi:hypothetical protein [Paenibacillus sp. L3-i20]|uniref:hypothetical protein n=1 Tax=Paenibacillus sp. L3-i20 TaxID=2905833 RepID=UPI0020BFC2D0|nr:hypothetical protein [Paenibacillus sp. L3-i20]
MASSVTESPANKLTFVSDDDYRIINLDTMHLILLNQIQESDYKRTKELLVDASMKPLTPKELESLNDKPGVNTSKNILPDGRFLKNNWEESQRHMIADLLTVNTFDGSHLSPPLVTEKFDVFIRSGHHNSILKMQKLQVNNKWISIPQHLDHLGAGFDITSYGENSILSKEDGIWLVNNTNNQVKPLIPSTYNGKTYEALMQESLDLYKTNNVIWNGGFTLSPDDTKLMYSSNRHDIANRNPSLFYTISLLASKPK